MGKKITVIPGDGIGPSIVENTIRVLEALNLDLEFNYVEAGETAYKKYGELVPESTLESIRQTGVALKGPLTTPIGKGFSSINLLLRKKFQLFANIRPVKTLPGGLTHYSNVDIITVRENTEGLYVGEGQRIIESEEEGARAESLSVITYQGAKRVIEHAFSLAKKLQRRKVTVVHKANILKSTSGLFLQTFREVAKHYPEIATEELIIDNCCMQLVMRPERFDVIVTSNLFGDIISDLCAGLVGGLGLAPGANIGKDFAIFEAVHGSAPDIAGKNIANPSALILAATMLLEHLGYLAEAKLVCEALTSCYQEKKFLTQDLGGQNGTNEFTSFLIQKL